MLKVRRKQIFINTLGSGLMLAWFYRWINHLRLLISEKWKVTLNISLDSICESQHNSDTVIFGHKQVSVNLLPSFQIKVLNISED